MGKKSFFSAKNITGIAVLLALVIFLQTVLGAIKVGATSFSLVLVPIVLGGLLFGMGTGAFLGFAFGLITLIYGVTGADPFTAILFNDHPLLTALTCLGKGTAAGFCGGLVYKLLHGKNELLGVFFASAIVPIVNTGLFIVGALLMSDTLSANFVADGMTVTYFLIIVCAGVNFLVEFAINLLAAPAIHRTIGVIRKGR